MASEAPVRCAGFSRLPNGAALAILLGSRLKPVLRTGALLLLLATAASAQLPWQQDFEDRLPGQVPAGWSLAWGNGGDDLLLTSNLRAASGQRSLLLDRQSGEQSPMGGYSTRYANLADGWLHFQFQLLLWGKADAVRFGFEWRGANPGDRVAVIGVDGRKVTFTSGDFAKSAPLGEVGEDQWATLQLWLPTTGGAQTEAVARLGDGPAVHLPAKPPASGHGTFMLVTYPGKRGYMAFLDSLSVTRADTAP